ncbi:protein kinase [bacterium]|nr:protein kinase [bacterium]
MTDKIINQYEIQEKLGSGGMGVVYKAHDTTLDRFVALKFLQTGSVIGDEERTRFLNEARVAAALNHPAICTIYEIAESDDDAFIAMEFLDGESLEETIKKGPLGVAETLRLATQIAEGLGEAHNRGVIHRDIKPANIMIDSKGRPKIMDFGLAKLTASPSLTKSRTTVGTIAYMSPEQVHAAPDVDHRTDIWSFGVLLYEMLSGQHPFVGDYEAAMMYSIVHEEPTPLAEHGLNLPESIIAILDRALAKQPDSRYQSVAIMADELQQIQGGRVGAVPMQKPTHNLPVQLTSFIGRGQELATIRELLVSTRLLTLTGPGGTGKTRLSQEAAATMIEDFEDGIFFVAMASLLEPELVPSTIAHTFGLFETSGQPVSELLIEHLKNKELLLLIDNFEQIVEAAPIILELLKSCPKLKIVVTSRIPLHIHGEQEFQVPPLQLPKLNGKSTSKNLAEQEAVNLFVQRAKAVKHNFGLTKENAREVAQICTQLDGLPLAIELAAARIKMFSPKVMLTRLNRRLDLLKAGHLDFPQRHQTLREAIAWSFDLLNETEQKVFRRLAVFVGGFNIAAAERLANFKDDIKGDVIDQIGALVDKNLVRVDEKSDESRFMLLETIREFGLERLESEDELTSAEQAHADYFGVLVAEAELTGPEQGKWLDLLEEEHDNLRAVMSRSEERREADSGLKIASVLWRLWAIRGYVNEGLERFLRLLALPGPSDTKIRATALSAAGTIAQQCGDLVRALPLLEQAVELNREVGDIKGVATALNHLGYLTILLGQPLKAQSYSNEALNTNRSLGDKRGMAVSLNNLGYLATTRGEGTTAIAHLKESLSFRREAGDERGAALELSLIGIAEILRGNYDDAMAAIKEATATLQELNDKQLLAWAIEAQGLVFLHKGEYETAESLFRDSISLWKESGNRYGQAGAMCYLAESLLYRGAREKAIPLLEESRDLQGEIQWGVARTILNEAKVAFAEGEMERVLVLCKQCLEIERKIENKYGIARCIEQIAQVKVANGVPVPAAELLGSAEAIRESIGAPIPPRSRAVHSQMRETLKKELGEQEFIKLSNRGKKRSLAESIEYASKILMKVASPRSL